MYLNDLLTMNLNKWISVIFLIIISCTVKSEESFRLPKNIIPEHYDLKILTDLGNDFSFKGKVCIDFTVTEKVNEIVLHSKNLNIFQNETKLYEVDSDGSTTGGSENSISRNKRNPLVTNWVFAQPNAYRFGKHLNYAKKKAVEKENAQEPVTNKLQTSTEKENPDETKVKDEVSTTTQLELNSNPVTENNKIIFRDPEKTESQKENGENSGNKGSVSTTEGSEPTSGPATNDTRTTGYEEKTSEANKYVSSTDSSVAAVTTTNPESTAPVTFTHPLSNEELSLATSKPMTASTSVTLDVDPEVNEPLTNAEASHQETYNTLKHTYHAETNFLAIQFDKFLRVGQKYRLELRYEGVLTDTLTGFHRVPYAKKGSQKSTWLASTVFEPNEARSAFPCFDEPNMKATFDVTLGHEAKYTALSNMPLASTTPVQGRPEWVWSTFKTTPRMSTYLVAFLISDFEYLTPRMNYSNSESNVTYRFWSRHDVLYKTRYAMRIVPEMKNYLEKLLDVRDVLPKHDFIALPSFVSTALENWGLYSFAEKNLLFTSGFSSIFSKFQITQVLGHEIAHMWFGNMVTPKWWNQIWLSEGFANFFEVVASDHIQPNWDLKTISVIFAYLKVFSLDAMQTSHPLVQKFNGPNDLLDIFDSISYQKGFYLVRMLNYTMGEEPFLKGVRKYLKANLLSNVDEDDLWEALNEYAHQYGNLPRGYHLKEIMNHWTRKAGYPILEVVRDYDSHTANITQKRFVRFAGDYEFRDNSLSTEEDESIDTKWWIPITYTTGSEMNFRDTKPKLWLNPALDDVTLIDMPSKDDFVLMNLDASGLYRVNYDERNWALLVSYLLNENFDEISVMNRVQILDDLLDLARSGEISYERALEATGYLTREKHFLPWKAALSNFDFILRMFRSTESNRMLKKFLRNLVAPRFEELGFEVNRNESFSDSLNRKQIAKWACKTGVRQCTRKSINLFKRWMEERRPDEYNPVPSNLRSVVYCSAIENGGNKEWQFLWQRYLSNVVTDKTPIINGLACSRNSRTLKKYLDWSIKESSGIRKQDTPAIFKAVSRNDVGFNLAKNFLRDKIIDVRSYLGNNPFFLPQMIDTLATKMNHPNDLEDLEEIENLSHYRSARRCFKQAYERVRFNIAWTEKNYRIISDWLKKQRI